MQNGFTLVEMSIVVLVIGFIVGAIFVGIDMRKNAQIHKISAKIQLFETSRAGFHKKYYCYPGDCPNATNYGLGANGDGNGIITDGGSPPAALFTGEILNYWQHLVAGNFISEDLQTAQCPLIGITNACISVAYVASPPPQLTQPSGNFYLLNTDARNPNTLPANPRNLIRITPEMMFGIDTKLDDGFPLQGEVRGYTSAGVDGSGTLQRFGFAGCSLPLAVANPRTYDITTDDTLCVGVVAFRRGL